MPCSARGSRVNEGGHDLAPRVASDVVLLPPFMMDDGKCPVVIGANCLIGPRCGI